MTTGLRDLYFAPITFDEDGTEKYGKPEKMAAVINADLSVNNAEAKLYADDSLYASTAEFSNGTLKLGVADLAQDVLAKVLGQATDSEGVTWADGTDVCPYVAVGFRANKGNGKYRYIWLQKVQFKIPSEAFETKGESIAYKTPEIEGVIMTNSKGKWKADYTAEPTEEKAAAWFTSVVSTVAA